MIKREFVLERATKNTYRYKEENLPEETLAFGTIYVQKELLPTKPQRIVVSVEEVTLK